MTTKKRRHWTAEKKLQIVEETRQTPQTVSGVCRHHGIATGQFYAWEKKARQAARLAEREQKLIQALETRGEYWQAYGNVKELHSNQRLHPVT